MLFKIVFILLKCHNLHVKHQFKTNVIDLSNIFELNVEIENKP